MILDMLRVIAITLGGVSIALKFPVLWAHANLMTYYRRGRLRFDDVGLPLALRSAAHTLALLYICVILVERVGEPFSWKLPGAYVVFIATIASLIATHKRDQDIKTAVRDEKGVKTTSGRDLND